MLLKRYPLAAFFVLAYLFTWVIEIPMLMAGQGLISLHMPRWLEALAAFGPLLAALLVLGGVQGRRGITKLFASTVRWRVAPVWWLLAVLSPFAVLLIALAVTGETGRLFDGELITSLQAEGRLFDIILLGGLLRGFGEEPGWRGFALPRLRERFNPLWATICLWPVWACWHLPAFLLRPEFAWGAWVGFSLGILAATAFLTWLFDATQSILLVALWHALVNVARSIAGQASQEAFFAFAQVMLLVGAAIILYWVFNPGTRTRPANISGGRRDEMD